MAELALEVAKLLGIGICIFGISWLILKSRQWTGAALDVRLEAVESDVHVMRGNLARVDRDLLVWHRQATEANADVLREINAVREMLAEKQSLHGKMDELRDRVDDVEQAIHGLPCGQVLHGVTAACPPKEK